MSWQTSYDDYRYRGIYRYGEPDGIEDSRERDYGDWVGSKITYRLPDGAQGHLTVGADLRIDLRALLNAFDIQPPGRPTADQPARPLCAAFSRSRNGNGASTGS